MYKLVLYGAGKKCKKICGILKQLGIEITAILDSNPDKWGEKVEEYVIECPEKLLELGDSYLYITVANADAVKTIREELQRKYQYNLEREISYNKLIIEAYENSQKIKKYILNGRIDRNKKEAIIFGCLNGLILGGIEEWTIGICKALLQHGKENIYILAKRGNYQVPSELENHVVFADIDYQRCFFMDSVLNIIEAIMKKLPCKIITTWPDEIMLAAYLVKCYYPEMIEIISTIRAGEEHIYEIYSDFRKCSDVYIGVSQDIKREMLQRGMEEEKVLTMCVPFACEKVLNRTYTVDCSEPIRIGYAGRIENVQKRMDLLLELMKELAEKKVNFRMELAGDGLALEEMKEYVSSNQLTGRVKFLGRIQRSEIPAFWKKQDICVNIADFEGRSHSIIEAMGNGAVPVVTATSGVREDITDDVNGYIVPLRDYHTMAEKIVYLAEHRERLAEMGKLAHDAVYPKSRMENHLKFWEDVLSHKIW